MHTPVLLKEVLDLLNPRPGEFFIDGTLGGGGHASEIIKKIKPGGIFLGADLSIEAVKTFDRRIEGNEVKIYLEKANFADLPRILRKNSLPPADGILLDLGFSSLELESGRGFSFLRDEPLLMTYDEEAEPLYRALRQLNQKEIFDIIRLTGERYAGRISKAVFIAGRKKPVMTSGEFAEIIRRAVPRNYERGRIDPATRTFLAFRIYLNSELENLEKFLRNLPQLLKPGGRSAIITFQSLEDRLVKNYFRSMVKEKGFALLNKKPIEASREEIKINPRARSAKLRAIKRPTDN